jgi:serine protease DegQ
MGIGFAIPVNTARQVLEGLVRDGQVTRGWIGVEPVELNADLAETFGIKQTEGVIITGVMQNGPAFKAGLRPGDVLLTVGDKDVHNVSELLTLIATQTPGTVVKMRIQRRNVDMTLDVIPAQRPVAKRITPLK